MLHLQHQIVLVETHGSWIANTSPIRTCIEAMNPIVLVVVLVLDTKRTNRGRVRERGRGRRGGSWVGDTSKILTRVGAMNLFWSPLSLPSPRKAGRGWPQAGRGVGSWEVPFAGRLNPITEQPCARHRHDRFHFGHIHNQLRG